jgi:putative cardiolipin synthase
MKGVLKLLGRLIRKISKYLLIYLIIVNIIVAILMNTRANNYKKDKDLEKIKLYDDKLALVDDITDGIRLRLELISRAKESLDICYYLIDNSNTATVFIDEVVKAADRGVKVRIITNKFNNNFKGKESWRKEILASHPNIDFYYYKNPFYNLYKLQDNTHDKVIIVDGTYLLTGGRNIADRFFIKNDDMVDDLDICLKRKSTSSAIDDYMAYYENLLKLKAVKKVPESKKAYEDLKASLRENLKESDKSFFSKNSVLDRLNFRDVKMTFVHNGLDKVVKDPEILYYLGKMGEKSKNIDRISPYIVPTKPIRNLANFNKNDHKIKFITNSKKTTPNFPGFGATLAYKSRTDKYGDFYSYKGQGSLHTKAVLYDDGLSALGSFNLDPRSAFLSTETMALIESDEFQKDLEKYLYSRDLAPWDEAKKEKVPPIKNVLLFLVRILAYVFVPLV